MKGLAIGILRDPVLGVRCSFRRAATRRNEAAAPRRAGRYNGLDVGGRGSAASCRR